MKSKKIDEVKLRCEHAHSLEAPQFKHKVFKSKLRANRKLVRQSKEAWLMEATV